MGHRGLGLALCSETEHFIGLVHPCVQAEPPRVRVRAGGCAQSEDEHAQAVRAASRRIIYSYSYPCEALTKFDKTLSSRVKTVKRKATPFFVHRLNEAQQV